MNVGVGVFAWKNESNSKHGMGDETPKIIDFWTIYRSFYSISVFLTINRSFIEYF
jgi:hypothetical protein